MLCVASNTPFQFLFTSITGIANIILQTTGLNNIQIKWRYALTSSHCIGNLYRIEKSVRQRRSSTSERCAFFLFFFRWWCFSVIQSIFSSATWIVTRKKKIRRADGSEHFDETNSSGRPVANTFPFNWFNNVFCFFVRSVARSFLCKARCDNFCFWWCCV